MVVSTPPSFGPANGQFLKDFSPDVRGGSRRSWRAVKGRKRGLGRGGDGSETGGAAKEKFGAKIDDVIDSPPAGGVAGQSRKSRQKGDGEGTEGQ